MINHIRQILTDIQTTTQRLSSDEEMPCKIQEIVEVIVTAFKRGNKVLLVGNGGSAADAQHFAGELVGRFKAKRRALPAIALTTNTSVLTAIGNDYCFDYVFARQLEALAAEGDVVIGITTSGNSRNVLDAIRVARQAGAHTVGLTGASGGSLVGAVDVLIQVPSQDTPRIQESLLVVEHIICELVERAFV